MKILFLTGNKYKFRAAANILAKYGIELIQETNEEPVEIQSVNVEDVATFAVKYHCKHLRMPIIKVDCGLYINALNGFPGTYTSDINKTIGAKGVLKLLEQIENRSAIWKDALAFATPKGIVKIFKSETPFEITKKPKGEGHWSFDSIMRPTTESKTFAEMTTEERLKSWKTTIFDQLGMFIQNEFKENYKG